MLPPPSKDLVGVEVMTTGHHRHRGTLRTRLLNDTQLLLDRVTRPRPSAPTQRICCDNLFENVHRASYVGTYDGPPWRSRRTRHSAGQAAQTGRLPFDYSFFLCYPPTYASPTLPRFTDLL